MRVPWALAAVAALAGSFWSRSAVRAADLNLVPNGNFETPNDKGDLPGGWFSDQPAKVQYVTGNSGHWVRFKDGGRIQYLLELKPEWKWLRVTAKMSTANIQAGAEAWNSPRVGVCFKAKGKDEWKTLEQQEDLDWIQRETGFQVPEGAEKATIEIGMYNPGTFEVDDVSITSVDEAAAKAAEKRNGIGGCLVTLKNGKFEHGTFELLKKDGWPRGWFIHQPNKTKVVGEANNRYMEISTDAAGWTCIHTNLLLRPEWESLRARARMKVSNLKLGKDAWNTSRITFVFKDEAGEKTGGKDTNWPPALELKADTDWTDVPEVALKVPPGSHHLEIVAGLQHSTGIFAFDNLVLEAVLKGGMAAPTVAAGATAPELSAEQRKAASQAPTVKLTEGGIQFSPDVAQRLQAARTPVEVRKQALVAVGPGAPGAKDPAVKWPKGWTVSDPGKELKGPAPSAVLEQLPEYLAANKPEVVLLWGDAAGKRVPGKLELYDWEDAAAVCLRMGALPVVVLPAGPGGAAGGGGGMLQPAAGGAEPKDQPDDLAEVRMAMQSAAEACGLMIVAPNPRETLGERLGRALAMLEKYVLARAPIEAGTGKTKTPGKDTDE
jgi:hypothetical protein